MIVVDSSALFAIILQEKAALSCQTALKADDDRLMSAATLTECVIVAMGKGVEHEMRRILDVIVPTIIPLTADRAYAAAEAYRRFGKGFHPAGLNYGDCFSYVMAVEHECPLLFVGNDFAKTDVRKVIAS